MLEARRCENFKTRIKFAMSTLSPILCACKGIRTCRACEAAGKTPLYENETDVTELLYCMACSKAWAEDKNKHPDHTGDSLEFPGVFLKKDFVTLSEERDIVETIYHTPFVDSQSGRRKQDYGPKVNFKRRKVKTANFNGLPKFSKELHSRMLSCDILSDFQPVEQCHLEYTPERGSSIDPHYDDFWLWGERLVTLNLLSDTILYFICDEKPGVEVHVPMFQRSLIVVYGDARSKWKHAIHRSDIKHKRLAITYRELSQEFCEGGARDAEGKDLLKIALEFNGEPVGSQQRS